MATINYSSSKILEFFDNLSPQNSGIFFSILLHLIILLFAVGLPNIFGPKDIFVPNIIPIEILNVSETTNIEKSDAKDNTIKKTEVKQKKFNSSENTEIQKEYKLTENTNTVQESDIETIKINEKINKKIEEKKVTQIKQKENTQPKIKVDTIKTQKIKPKLKPKLSKIETTKTNSDLQIEPKIKQETESEKKIDKAVPKSKPKEDFSIASMLKDLRNEKSNNVVDNEEVKKEEIQTGKNDTSENMVLSISEIDLLRQQLSSCWNAPAGAVINVGDKVTISAKIQQNMNVFSNSVRIVDTNISKSNPFYGPITDSAMRTLLNPECSPLKLPKDKYNLWKNLTITFDYSIMKGY